jgi:hypothetical protein
MSQHYYLKRDKLSWRYKNQSYPFSSWNFFTDHETDLPSMKKYLSRSSDSVSVSFTDDNLKPANYFEVRRKDGNLDVSMNAGEKKFSMFDYDFIEPQEIEAYFHDRTTPEIIEKADRQKGLSKAMFYKDNADVHTLEGYNQMLKERMSDDAVLQKLKDFDPEIVSQVFFEDNLNEA